MTIAVSAELIEAAQKGAPSEVERLLEAIWPDAYRLAYSVLRDAQRAEDAAQEACIIIYRTIASLRSPLAFRVWVYRIVVRAAIGLRPQGIAEQISLPIEATEASVTAIDVWRALSTLPTKLRDVIVLRYFEDLSSREIACIMRLPEGTVRFRLAIAKRRLRPQLICTDQKIPSNSEVRRHAV